METVRAIIREFAGLAAVIAVAILANNGAISGDAAAAILGAVAGAGVGSAVSTRAVLAANKGNGGS